MVISGGGPLGFRYIGALEKLEMDGFWKLEDIESIYGTSIGSVIAAFICLKYDWETLNKYIIERPWKEAFKVTAKQIFDSYYNKGLFDKKIIEIIFKPLLEAKNLDLNITLKEFYEYSKIDFHIFTFDLNKFQSVELSHTNHPDLSLIQALTMSSSLPGIFIPTILDGCCYIDGGVLSNYPINECLRDHSDEEEILGIKLTYNEENGGGNISVTPESSLLEYVISMSINSMNYIRDSVTMKNIKYTLKCSISDNPLTLSIIQDMIKSQELRKNWMKIGEEDAVNFLQSINQITN